jgi:hypothetical protein
MIGGQRRRGDGNAGGGHQGDTGLPEGSQQRAFDPIALMEIIAGRHPKTKSDDHTAIGEIMHADLRRGLSGQAGDGGDGVPKSGDGFVRIFLIADGDEGFDDALLLGIDDHLADYFLVGDGDHLPVFADQLGGGQGNILHHAGDFEADEQKHQSAQNLEPMVHGEVHDRVDEGACGFQIFLDIFVQGPVPGENLIQRGRVSGYDPAGVADL